MASVASRACQRMVRAVLRRLEREDKEDRSSKLTLTGDLHEDVGTARVQVDKLGQVVDSRVDDDPEVILLVVLWSSRWGTSGVSVACSHMITMLLMRRTAAFCFRTAYCRSTTGNATLARGMGSLGLR